MPIFNYICPKCKEEIEKIVKDSEQKIACATCGTIMERQLSAPGGFVKKGEGFYKRN